ncbi:transcriptional regulator, GntR family [[Clostridium] saccharolyticum WM1]|uniref:Transcriptional regulator, GntR family n=1 Tax=Lacrimispora saccharolytica (strain ATCC 35040 / DSM 2544 / NRCC 2533 / WM1) TaxID=610130 RepID=D9R9M4_LACSW|nr:transcriptional regulator, GntR family [[Clostridium] saccharolyticum WM1]
MIDYRMPLYIQLQDMIIKKIEDKEYLPGELIPSERKMAELYGVNRMTVKRTIHALVEKGYLYRIQGSGTYVAKSERVKVNMGFVNEMINAGITAMLKDVGMTVTNHVLGKGDVEAGRFICAKLGLAFDEPVYGLHRVRQTGDKAIAVEYTYVPKKFFQDMDEIDFKNVSLYDYMEARSHTPRHFVQNLIVVEAAEKEANLLGVKEGSAIFLMEYIGADISYNIVEFTESYMNPENIDFQYMVVNADEN